MMKTFLLLAAVMILQTLPSLGQSLADVLSSVQERKLLVEQKKSVVLYTEDLVAGLPNETYGGPQLISWGSLPSFPENGDSMTPSDTDGLSMTDRLDLMNQAVREFDKLKVEFLNVSSKRLADHASSPRGLLLAYTEYDLPSPGLVTPSNYRQKLIELAAKTVSLKVVSWPAKGEVGGWYGSGAAGTVIDLATMNPQPISPYDVVLDGDKDWGESANVQGYNYSGTSSGTAGIQVYKSITTHSKPPNWNEGESPPIPSISGDSYLVTRRRYNPASLVTVDSEAPRPNSETVEVLHKFNSGSGTKVVHATIPKFSVTGTMWAPPNTINHTWFEPTGCSWDDVVALENYSPIFMQRRDSVSGVWMVFRRDYSLAFAGDFQRGLDSSSLQSLNDLPPSSLPSGNPVITPDPGLLFAIDLGTSEYSATRGAIGVYHPGHDSRRADANTSAPSDRFVLGGPTGSWNLLSKSVLGPGVSNPDIKHSYGVGYPSLGSDLRFIGTAEDFVLFYDGIRTSPPDWPGSTEGMARGWFAANFLVAWDRPRLRQVIGKTIIADIVYQPHRFETTILIYRRLPSDALGDLDEPVTIDPSKHKLLATHKLKPNEDLSQDQFPEELYFSLKLEDEGSPTRSWTFEADNHDVHSYTIKRRDGTGVVGTRILEITDGDEPAENPMVNITDSGDTVLDLTVEKGDVTNPAAGGPPTNTNPTGAPLSDSLGTADNVLDPYFAAQRLKQASGSQELIHDYTPDTRYTTKLAITDPVNPDQEYNWANGFPGPFISGSWKTEFSEDSGALKAVRSYDTNTYATAWTEWNNDDGQVVITSAPNGSISTKADDKNSVVTIDYYGPSEGVVPFAIKETTNRDGTGSTHTYTLTSGVLDTVTKIGKKSGSTVTAGQQIETSINNVGMPVSRKTSEIGGATLENLTWGAFTDWGAPQEVKSDLQDLTSTWIMDGARLRLSSSQTPFGVSTSGITYDTLDRPSGYTWDSYTGTVSYPGGLGVTNSLPMGSLGDRGSRFTTDGFGNLASARQEGGRPISLDLTRAGGQVTAVLDDSGANRDLTSVYGQADGALLSQSGSVTVGNTGSGLSVQNGLFVQDSTINDLGSTTTVHSDAWGRPHIINAMDESGAVTDTTIFYSDPEDALKRVVTEYPSGQVHVSEADPYDAEGAVQWSGFKKSGTAAFTDVDRYTKSVTTASGSTVLTVHYINDNSVLIPNIAALREFMRSETNPVTGEVVITFDEGDTEIIRKPNYSTSQTMADGTRPVIGSLTVRTISSDGWYYDSKIDKHGQLEGLTPGGTGAPSLTLTPVMRADGTLEKVTMSDGTGTMEMLLGTDGIPTSLKISGIGVIPGQTNLVESFEFTPDGGIDSTINGVSGSVSGDGLTREQSGEGVLGHSRTTVLTNGAATETITPDAGGLGATVITANAAGAPTAKDYSGPNDTSTTWLAGGRIDDHTLGRGSQVDFIYTADQFFDLWKVDYPGLSSGLFSTSAITEEFSYDTAGRVSFISDQSGTRDLDYEKSRLVETDYTGGELNPYTVRRTYTNGRQTSMVVERDEVAIHSAIYSYSGASRELQQITSAGATSVYQRDGGASTGPRLLTRITRGAVQQQYTRDMNAGGRITHANSNGTTAAPTFHYSAFDSHGRRETCATSKGNWDWDYSSGQLTDADNSTLGTFQYVHDVSGRRTGYQVPGSGLLNPTLNDLGQTLTLPRDQQYSLFINAVEDAELWINGQQITDPTYPFYFEKTTGFASGGGWEHWDLLAVLPGAGEPGAAPDAKSELEGYVWIPPLSESMTHDGDGNRQSTAQWDYGWDARNRLIAARTKDHLTASKGWDLEFDYDAEGKRFKKTVKCYESGQLVEDKIITFLWDGWDLVYERHEDGNNALLLERKYTWGLDISGSRGGAGGAGGLLAMEETQWLNGTSATTTVLPLYDGSGHVIGLADSTGNLLAEYWYGPFGELIEASGEMASANPWRYATKYHDVETGLYYFGHRYYDPNTGQWLSREPLGESESLNLYSYCHNDPINYVDVLGLAEKKADGSNPLSRLIEWFIPGTVGGAMTDPIRGQRLVQQAEFRRDVTVPIAQIPANMVRGGGAALGDAATDWGGDQIAAGNPVRGMAVSVIGGVGGDLVGAGGSLMDPMTGPLLMEQGGDYFGTQSGTIWDQSGGGVNGTFQVGRHVLTEWNVERAYNGFASGDIEEGMAGAGATAGVFLTFTAPYMMMREPLMHGNTVNLATQSVRRSGSLWQGGGRLNPLNYRVPAGELYAGVPRLTYRGPPVPTIKHHIFNKFRGKSPQSQKYRDFFKEHGIQVDDFTVGMSETFHKQWVHRAGNNWTTKWKRWIDANPGAITIEVYQQGGRMMNEFGINHLPLVPYR